MKLLKNFTKKIIKTTANTTGAVLKGTIDGLDESINGDDIKEVRIERNDRRNKIRNFEKTVWSLALLATLGLITHSILINYGNIDLIESVTSEHGFLLAVPFLIAIMLTIFSDKFFK